jgi:hypothetical protein
MPGGAFDTEEKGQEMVMAQAQKKLDAATSIAMPPSIRTRWELITPQIAATYMERNFDRNRSLRKGWIATLKQVMAAGEFRPTHQGIAFDEQGHLIDGQHRLQAVIESGISVWLLVARDVPRDAVLTIDLHARRNPADQIRIVDESCSPNNTDVAIARVMRSGAREYPRGGGNDYLFSTERIHQFLLAHWDAVRFSQHHTGGGQKRIRGAPIRAAIARAYYHLERERLEQFMLVLGTYLAESPRDHAAVTFRKYLDEPANSWLTKGGGGESRGKLYGVTVAAIQAFFKGQMGRGLKPIAADEDPFPLPE